VVLVRRRETLANPPTPAKRLFQSVRRGEIQALLGSEPRHVPASASPQRRLKPQEVDRMASEYRSGKTSTDALAEKYTVDPKTVAAHLRSRGLRLGRLPLNNEEIRRAKELHAHGLSLNAVGRRMGRDPKTVKAAIAIETNPPC